MDVKQGELDLSPESGIINELQRKVEMLTTFIDSAEAGMYVTDYHTGEILYANRKMVSLGGDQYPPESLIGQTCWTLVNRNGEGRCPFCPHEMLLGPGGEPLQTSHVWEHYFPEYKMWLKVSSQIITWVDGRMAQMNTFFDITETKQMQNQLAEYARAKEHRRMQQNLQTVLDVLPIPVKIIDLKTHQILYGNKATLDLLGFASPRDIIGQSVDTVMPETQVFVADAAKRYQLTRDCGPVSTEVVCLRPDGGRLDLLVTSCIIDYNGKKAFLSVMENLEREKRYQNMQNDLQDILDRLPIPVRITQQDNAEIVYANQSCAKLFGYDTPDEITGRIVSDFLPVVQSDGTSSKDKLDTLLYAEESLSLDVEYHSSKGTIIDGRITVCLIDYFGKRSTLGIITDLAAEKEKQRILRGAAEKERESNQLKSSFLSNMSHEVRTPMNAIIGLTDIELNRPHPKETLETYRKINISARNLLQIANDILDLSKIEANKLELFSDEFDLEEVLDSALLVVSPRLEGKQVELLLDASLDLPRYLIGDKTRLWQILKNYLDNAAKYTQQGNIVLTVAEDFTRSSSEYIWINFTVTDTGIGMDENQLRKAFLPYEQVYNDAQKRYVGTGLGLPISKRLCELMGGLLNIESRQGHGTIVRFSIPFLRSTNEETERQRIHSLSGQKILLVDDGEFALRITLSLLQNAGADCTTARSGEEALEVIHERQGKEPPFDLILLDYLLDGINGLETAKRIHWDASPTSKILIITSYESALIRSELVEYGVDDIIEKPYVPSVFIQKIRIAAGLEHDTVFEHDRTFIRFKDVRVLICEDNEINQEVAVSMLEEFGIQAIAADNGRHGLELLESGEPFDLILMDLHMPIMDGFDATRAIRTDERFRQIPIISLTADAMTEVLDKCIEAGMDDYLSKPIEMGHLNAMVFKWLPPDKLAP